jgi:hypothetical protein
MRNEKSGVSSQTLWKKHMKRPDPKTPIAPANWPTFENYSDVTKTREASIAEAAHFLQMSIKAINEVFIDDPNFAVRNPEVTMAFMQAALFDFHATRFGELLEFIEGHLGNMRYKE